MDNQTQKEYVNGDGQCCPYCGGDVEFGDDNMVVENSLTYIPSSCFSCGKEWVDIYKLSGCISKEEFEKGER
jgi:hypothetical protein